MFSGGHFTLTALNDGVSTTPEPGTLLLLGLALFTMMVVTIPLGFASSSPLMQFMLVPRVVAIGAALALIATVAAITVLLSNQSLRQEVAERQQGQTLPYESGAEIAPNRTLDG